MLNVAKLNALTNSAADLESRCRSIARNAVQASREAHGRGDSLYTDDEAKRERMIEQILHLDLSKYDNGSEGASLVAQVQPINPVIDRISDILERGLEEELNRDAAQAAVGATAAQNVIKVKTPKDSDPS